MAGYADFRDFLAALEKEGQLLAIADEVKLEPDLAAAACAATQLGETSPALRFDRIAGFDGQRIVMNAHGSWPNHALALGLPKDATPREQFFAFVERYQKYPGEIERVATAPFQEVVVD